MSGRIKGSLNIQEAYDEHDSLESVQGNGKYA